MNDEELAELKERVRVAELRTELLDTMPIVAPTIHADYWLAAATDVIRTAGPDSLLDKYGRLDVEIARQHLDEFSTTYPKVTERRPPQRLRFIR